MAELAPQELNAMVSTRGRRHLSRQEKRTLEYASRGLEMEMIAEAMCLSAETIKVYLRNARFLTRGKNTAHACSNAIRLGWID